MSDSIVDLVRAMDFAARKHVGKRRKGVDAEPYMNHLTEVALLVAQATKGKDPRLLMAALLHDTIEDTGTSQAELAQAFGKDIAALVAEVTDDTTLSFPKTHTERLTGLSVTSWLRDLSRN